MTESQDAFAELLATLGEVGDRFAGEEWGLTDPGDVAEGLRVIVHHLATGIETQLEQDAAHPTFRAIVTPWRKALGDNADARYHDAPVHPAGTYRVRGRTGGAVYVSFTVEAGAEEGAFPTGTVGVLNDTEFDVAADGSFEITLGGPPQDRGLAGRWPPTRRGSPSATTGSRRRRRRPRPAPTSALSIELVDGDVPERPPAPTDASVAASIRRMAHLRAEPHRSTPWPSRARASRRRSCPGCPHEFPPPVPPGAHALAAADAALLHGALPARPRRRPGDHGPLARVPLRQRVALEPPDADLRLPARPGQPQPGPGRGSTPTARSGWSSPTATRACPTGSPPRAARSAWCSGASSSPRARSTPRRPRSSPSTRSPDRSGRRCRVGVVGTGIVRPARRPSCAAGGRGSSVWDGSPPDAVSGASGDRAIAGPQAQGAPGQRCLTPCKRWKTAAWAAAEGSATPEQLQLLEADPVALARDARGPARRRRGPPRRGAPARRARARAGRRRLRGRAGPARGRLRPALQDATTRHRRHRRRRPGRRGPAAGVVGRRARSWLGRRPRHRPGHRRRAGRPARGHRRPGRRLEPAPGRPAARRAPGRGARPSPSSEALGWLVAVGGGLGREGVGASVTWLGRVAVAAVRLVAAARSSPPCPAPSGPTAGPWTSPCAGCPALVDEDELDELAAAMPGPVVALAPRRSPHVTLDGARRGRRRHRPRGRRALELPGPAAVVRTTARGGRGLRHPPRRLHLRRPGRPPAPRWPSASTAGPSRSPAPPGASSSSSSTRPTRATPGSCRCSARAPRARCCPSRLALADGKATKPARRRAGPPRAAASRPCCGPAAMRRGQVYLSQDEAWELMTVTGPLLEAAGFDVRVPALSRRKPVAGAAAVRRARPATPWSAPTSSANVRWSVAVRRRRAHRRRHRPPGRRGPAAGALARPVGRARPRRPQGGRRRPGRAGRQDAADRRRDPPPRPRPRGHRRSPAASPSTATAGPPTCSSKAVADLAPSRSPRPRASSASCAATRPRPWPGSASSTPSSSAAAWRSTWAWARRPRARPPGPHRRRRPGPGHRPARGRRQLGGRGRPVHARPAGASSTTAPPGPSGRRSPTRVDRADVVITTYGTAVRDVEALAERAVGPRGPRRGPGHQEPGQRDRPAAAPHPRPHPRRPHRHADRERPRRPVGHPRLHQPRARRHPRRVHRPAVRARARPPCGPSTASSCSAAPRASRRSPPSCPTASTSSTTAR